MDLLQLQTRVGCSWLLEEALEISHPDSSDRAVLFNVLPLDTSNVVYKKDEAPYQANQNRFGTTLPTSAAPSYFYFEVWVGLSRLRSVSYHHPSS